ncbi:MerR family transcriptional regulator [Thiomicrospira pelophila]|uniref:MerR family transcriptional regulator n=1 Tax=Thiomicrospira pelophila TaxID=934 RepID=UPI0004A70DED|nr:MerR family transcriptional regulator [Thiomicrospira pelophila]
MPSTKSSTQPQLEINLPDKKYFTIGEVSQICQLKSHVLRYWEQVFPQLNPNKRRGRRYYQKADVELLIEIKSLLHEQGYTIPGAKARLSQANYTQDLIESAVQEDVATNSLDKIKQIHTELLTFKRYIQQRY